MAMAQLDWAGSPLATPCFCQKLFCSAGPYILRLCCLCKGQKSVVSEWLKLLFEPPDCLLKIGVIDLKQNTGQIISVSLDCSEIEWRLMTAQKLFILVVIRSQKFLDRPF